MTSMSPERKAFCLLLLLAIASSSGSAQQGPREVMANAMARMMDAMGLFDSAPSGQGTANWGSVAGEHWSNPVSDPSQALAMQELMQEFARQAHLPSGSGSDWPTPWTPSRLEGVWEGRDGELLIVQGNRFRIYSPAVQHGDGLIQIQGERLALYNPLDQRAQGFEFAESQGRLIMRDLAGQVYLYRRLRLDGKQGYTAPQVPPDR